MAANSAMISWARREIRLQLCLRRFTCLTWIRKITSHTMKHIFFIPVDVFARALTHSNDLDERPCYQQPNKPNKTNLNGKANKTQATKLSPQIFAILLIILACVLFLDFWKLLYICNGYVFANQYWILFSSLKTGAKCLSQSQKSNFSPN